MQYGLTPKNATFFGSVEVGMKNVDKNSDKSNKQ
jgi:hypothetical protein